MLFSEVFVRTLGGQIFQNSNEGANFTRNGRAFCPNFIMRGAKFGMRGAPPPIMGWANMYALTYRSFASVG